MHLTIKGGNRTKRDMYFSCVYLSKYPLNLSRNLKNNITLLDIISLLLLTDICGRFLYLFIQFDWEVDPKIDSFLLNAAKRDEQTSSPVKF